MAQHTPGPWEVGDEARGDDPRMVYCDDATGQRVADCSGKYLFHTRETMEANARLIAAAPDMLAALKALGPIMADIGYFGGADPAKVSANADSLGKQVISSNQKACNAAWDAIAKAEGRP